MNYSLMNVAPMSPDATRRRMQEQIAYVLLAFAFLGIATPLQLYVGSDAIGVVSLVVPLESGETIESAMIGRESLVGGSAALNGQVSVCKAVVQIGGAGSVLDIDKFRSLADSSATCRAALFKHEQLILVQAQQSAACNATHTVETRLARWLLRARDLQGSDDLQLTQEFIAEMMGVRRTSVSVVANTLAQAGFLRYSRGQIRIRKASHCSRGCGTSRPLSVGRTGPTSPDRSCRSGSRPE